MVVMATFLRCCDSEGAKAAVSILPVVSRKQQPTRQTGGSFRSRGRMSQPASSRREQTRPGTRAKPLIPLARRCPGGRRSTPGHCSIGVRWHTTDFDYHCEANHLTAIACTPPIAVNLDETRPIEASHVTVTPQSAPKEA